MRKIETVLASALVVLTVCSVGGARVTPVGPIDPGVRVEGPAGLSYVVPTGRWTTGSRSLEWRDTSGRSLASVSHASTFDAGYADGACREGFSARAVVGFAVGRSHAGVVRRFVRAVGGPPRETGAAPTWRPTLSDRTPVRLTRTVVEVDVDAAACQASRVEVAVVTPATHQGRGRHVTSWVFVGDLADEGAPMVDVEPIAASLRSG